MMKEYTNALLATHAAISNDNYSVAVICKDDESARRKMRMYFEIITPLLSGGEANLFHHRRKIQFANGSKIIFTSDETQLRGLHIRDTVRD